MSVTHSEKSARGCGCAPTCPACSGLTCLCRPRFFVGQILSDDDLNALERYVVDKNKLHNRYLHGWGVVCGLKVSRSACADRVDVTPGYALGPCGDDIVVCKQASVSICDLIRRCRPPKRGDDCPPFAFDPGDRADAMEEWVLAICYDEQTARGVMPLRGGDDCGCGGHDDCKCGKTKSCGCGKSDGGRRNGARRTPPPACEPTVTCEGFTFTVYKPPKRKVAGTRSPGVSGMAEIIATQLKAFSERFAPHPPKTATAGALRAWMLDTRQGLADWLDEHPPQTSGLFDALRDVTPPDPAGHDGEAYIKLPAYQAALVNITQIATSNILAALCDTLMPPCPAPVDCDCVPLATVRVQRSDCKVLSVCNWGPRKFALTFPDLIYWLEATGVTQKLHAAVETLCCPAKPIRPEVPIFPRPVVLPPIAARVAPGGSPFAHALAESFADPSRTVDARALALAALSLSPDGKPAASAFETDNPLTALGVHVLVKPVIQALLPPDWTAAWSAPVARPAETNDVQVLRDRLDQLSAALDRQIETTKELNEKVKAQQAEIRKLKPR